jgi:hypothetical protein
MVTPIDLRPVAVLCPARKTAYRDILARTARVE